ncbi:ABC transporter permease [Pseudonocardia sp. KRD291]|uniref:ABC transporter permease n=1 Tax=Pseudonocardia sp. KRD291 TaxID=2792007 RepID=UPI001C4A0AB5|nr:ABC transporter permease [Pseudonocardia sp. KRD291]MBW0104793.1 ABC transporter permease [Pseudonocardia sp. KRD291]
MSTLADRATPTWRSARVAVAAAVVVLVVLAVLPLDAITTDLSGRFAGPSLAHPLGTDQLGRDVLARLAAGTRLSVGFTLVALAICTGLGTLLGVLAAWAGRAAGQAFQRLIDVLVSVPAIVVGLVVVAASEGPPGLDTLLLAVVLTGWTPFARLTYQLTVRERAREYVEGAVAVGAGPLRIAFRHVLPNLLRPLTAHACLRFSNVLLSLAGLSFLGLGVQPPTPEWGAMLDEGRQYMFAAPQLVLLPAAAIVGTALLVTVLGRLVERRWNSA